MINMKKKLVLKKSVLFILILLIIGSLVGGGYFFYTKKQEELEKARQEAIKKKIINIKKHYADTVYISKKSTLYEKKNDKYEIIGSIEKDNTIALDKMEINHKTKYFKIMNLDYYISYKNLKPSEEEIVINDRYKRYLAFNENIKTKKTIKLMQNNKVKYILNKELDTPIIEKDDNGYYIECLGEEYFISKDDVESVYEKQNNSDPEAVKIPVTANHFIYLEGDNTCNEIICHPASQIKEEYNYLRENNYFTLNTTELRKWLEDKIRLPEKSILITIDDGARAEKFIPLLEEYKVNATLFLISSWYPVDKFKSPYMEIASHTHALHEGGHCPGGQGSPLKCLDKKKLVDDLTTSRKTLNNTEAFCYPFYEFNDYSEQVVKEAGFKMAFIGGQMKARKGINIYRIPRITMTSTTTLQEYINYIKP